MPQLVGGRNAGPRVRAHSGCQALTIYSRRRHTAKYSIQAPCVFDHSTRSSVCRKQNTHQCRSPPSMTKAPTVTPAFECRPWKVKQKDHVSSTQLNEMMSCTAAAHAVTTDASTHNLQPSAAHGKVQHPRPACIRQDHQFVGSKARTDANHHRR